MKIICTNCGHSQEIDAAKQLGSIGGKKSRRTITKEQQAAMQAARIKGRPRKIGDGMPSLSEAVGYVRNKLAELNAVVVPDNREVGNE